MLGLQDLSDKNFKGCIVLSLFKSKPLVDQETADWIFETFAWALQHFDADEFFNRTQLVLPSNEFFPGRVSSVEEKAANIFQHTQRYVGLNHWPLQLLSSQQLQQDPQCQIPPAPQPELEQILRDSLPSAATAQGVEAGKELIQTEQPLQVFYNPQQTLKPEDMAASYAHVLAQHLVVQGRILPPGGQNLFAEASELLAGFMGFGVLLANSSYTIRGGCGSCYNAMANRQPALTEYDNVFVLALFCQLKGIDRKTATRYLKKHLHRPYKLAVKQIEAEPDKLAALQQLR